MRCWSQYFQPGAALREQRLPLPVKARHCPISCFASARRLPASCCWQKKCFGKAVRLHCLPSSVRALHCTGFSCSRCCWQKARPSRAARVLRAPMPFDGARSRQARPA